MAARFNLKLGLGRAFLPYGPYLNIFVNLGAFFRIFLFLFVEPDFGASSSLFRVPGGVTADISSGYFHKAA